MSKIYVKPATPETLVPDPDRGGFLPPEGRWVEAYIYWHRRVEDRDVIEVVDPPAPDADSPSTPANRRK